MTEALLNMNGITKTFKENGVKAVDSANLTVNYGEIHAIIGENGAGKSTLMHILAGETSPDTGTIFFKNRKVNFYMPSDALKSGIVMLHQNLQLIPELTVLDNIILGSEPSFKFGVINRRKALRQITELCNEFYINIDPDKKVGSLSADERQKTALLSILFHDPGLLIFDEPTTFFSEIKTDNVHKLIRKLKRMGKSIIIITHKIKEAVEIADKITIMRAGLTITHIDSMNTNSNQLSKLMLGKDKSLPFERKIIQPGKIILKAQNITYTKDKNDLLKITFEIKEKEILVVTGIRENGLETLELLLSGQLKPTSGNFIYKNRVLKPSRYNLRNIKAGYIPSDRIKTGTSINSSISDNMLLLKYKAFTKWGLFNTIKIDNYVISLINEYGIKGKPGQIMSTLSGGNIQRVMISREMKENPDLFIFAEPSRGLDIKSKRLIYEKIFKLKDKGSGILIISSDIEEALQIADRLLILYMGKVVASLENNNIDRAYIGKLMLGLTK